MRIGPARSEALALLFGLLTACAPHSDGDEKAPAPCTITAPTSCPDPPPTYADAAAVFEARCQSCHSGVPDGPWPLTDYEHVADWADTIRTEVLYCVMPPPDAGVPITDDERRVILTWIRCGAPR